MELICHYEAQRSSGYFQRTVEEIIGIMPTLLCRRPKFLEHKCMFLKVRQGPKTTAVLVVSHFVSQKIHGVEQIAVSNTPLPYIVNIPPNTLVLRMKLVYLFEQRLVSWMCFIMRNILEIFIAPQIKEPDRFLRAYPLLIIDNKIACSFRVHFKNLIPIWLHLMQQNVK